MKPKLIVVLPDQQCPYQDPALHQLVCDWLKDEKPAEVILSGDLTDFPTLSRFAPTFGYTHTALEVLESSKDVLDDYARAAPKARRRLIPGNHEERWMKYIWKGVPELAEMFDKSLPEALELDTLGYEWVGSPHARGPAYPHAMAILSPHIAVAHGWIARKASGSSALATLEHLGHSIVVGHTHRQAVVGHTYHQIDGSLRVLRAVEAGTLAIVRGGLGYAVAPNWTPGFVTVWLHEDGTFNLNLATYVNGTLFWQEDRYN